MKDYSKAIAFSALCICCTMLEIYASGAGKLWILVVVWGIFFGDTKVNIK